MTLKPLVVPAMRGPGWSIAARAAIIYVLANPATYSPLRSLGIEIFWSHHIVMFAHRVWELFPKASGLPPSLLTAERVYSYVWFLLFTAAIGALWYVMDRRRRHEAAIFEAA